MTNASLGTTGKLWPELVYQTINDRLNFDITGTAQTSPSAQEVMAALSQEIARLTLGSPAGTFRKTDLLTAETVQTRHVSSSPAAPLSLFLGLLFTYAAIVVALLIWVVLARSSRLEVYAHEEGSCNRQRSDEDRDVTARSLLMQELLHRRLELLHRRLELLHRRLELLHRRLVRLMALVADMYSVPHTLVPSSRSPRQSLTGSDERPTASTSSLPLPSPALLSVQSSDEGMFAEFTLTGRLCAGVGSPHHIETSQPQRFGIWKREVDEEDFEQVKGAEPGVQWDDYEMVPFRPESGSQERWRQKQRLDLTA